MTKILFLIGLCCCLTAPVAAREATELRQLCAGTAIGTEMTLEQQKAVCTARVRRAVATNVLDIFDDRTPNRVAKFLEGRPELVAPGITDGMVVTAMILHWSDGADAPLGAPDLKKALGVGLIGAGAALLVGVALMIPRWIWIGMKSDLRRRRELKTGGRRGS